MWVFSAKMIKIITFQGKWAEATHGATHRQRQMAHRSLQPYIAERAAGLSWPLRCTRSEELWRGGWTFSGVPIFGGDESPGRQLGAGGAWTQTAGSPSQCDEPCSGLHTGMLIIKLNVPLGNYANDIPETTYISGNIWLKVLSRRAASKARLHSICSGPGREGSL